MKLNARVAAPLKAVHHTLTDPDESGSPCRGLTIQFGAGQLCNCPAPSCPTYQRQFRQFAC